MVGGTPAYRSLHRPEVEHVTALGTVAEDDWESQSDDTSLGSGSYYSADSGMAGTPTRDSYRTFFSTTNCLAIADSFH
jgi:hypothetical protein